MRYHREDMPSMPVGLLLRESGTTAIYASTTAYTTIPLSNKNIGLKIMPTRQSSITAIYGASATAYPRTISLSIWKRGCFAITQRFWSKCTKRRKIVRMKIMSSTLGELKWMNLGIFSSIFGSSPFCSLMYTWYIPVASRAHSTFL